MRRLAIVDLAGGDQPIPTEDGRLAIVGNGEIYNAPELRRELRARGHRFRGGSDIEVALHLFEECGEDAFARLHGMFALALIDTIDGHIVVARDRLGIKPLFLACAPAGTLFASEVPALRAGLEAREADLLAVDPAALRDYLALGYIPAPRTLHSGVQRLPGGHLARLAPGRVEIVRWWRYPDPIPEDRPLDEWAEELRALLRSAVQRRTMGDVQAGALLSGGLDSGAVLGLLAEATGRSVPCFTIAFDDPRLDETELASACARHHGAEHHIERLGPPTIEELETLFTRCGEPLADVSLLPMHRLARLARRSVKFVLSGDGGDELFAGYSWLRREVQLRTLPGAVQGAARALRPLLSWGQRSTRSGMLGQLLRGMGDLSVSPLTSFLRRRSLCPPFLLPRLLPAVASGTLPPSPLEAYARTWQGEDLALLLELDRRYYLPGDILEKVDRATMMHSLEARVPLLDHRIVEFAARIPVATHLGPSGAGKAVLRRAIAPYLPPAHLHAPKRGFGIPVDTWFQGRLLDEVEERVRTLPELGLIEAAPLAGILTAHRVGRAQLGHLLWGLLSLAVTARHALDPSERAGHTTHAFSS